MRINRIENELDIIDAGLITENPTSVLSAFLSTHAWIVDDACFCCIRCIPML